MEAIGLDWMLMGPIALELDPQGLDVVMEA